MKSKQVKTPIPTREREKQLDEMSRKDVWGNWKLSVYFSWGKKLVEGKGWWWGGIWWEHQGGRSATVTGLFNFEKKIKTHFTQREWEWKRKMIHRWFWVWNGGAASVYAWWISFLNEIVSLLQWLPFGVVIMLKVTVVNKRKNFFNYAVQKKISKEQCSAT